MELRGVRGPQIGTSSNNGPKILLQSPCLLPRALKSGHVPLEQEVEAWGSPEKGQVGQRKYTGLPSPGSVTSYQPLTHRPQPWSCSRLWLDLGRKSS